MEEFVGKDQDHALAENMKKKYGLVKGNRGYDINLISDEEVCFTAYILAEKIMRKYCTYDVPASVVSLAT